MMKNSQACWIKSLSCRMMNNYLCNFKRKADLVMKARIPGADQSGNMMKRLQKMQEDIANVQEEVENSEFSATVGGGAVEVTVNGKHETVAIKLQPEVVDPDDIDMLQDLLIAAFNEGVRKATEAMENGIEQAKGGLSIPGLM